MTDILQPYTDAMDFAKTTAVDFYATAPHNKPCRAIMPLETGNLVVTLGSSDGVMRTIAVTANVLERLHVIKADATNGVAFRAYW